MWSCESHRVENGMLYRDSFLNELINHFSHFFRLDDGQKLYDELKADHDAHLPLHVAWLHALDAHKVM